MVGLGGQIIIVVLIVAIAVGIVGVKEKLCDKHKKCSSGNPSRKQHKGTLGKIAECKQRIFDYYWKILSTKTAIIGCIIAVVATVVILLLVNIFWVIAERFSVQIESPLTYPNAMELFLGTMSSCIITFLAWRLDQRIAQRDRQHHKEEMEAEYAKKLYETPLMAQCELFKQDNFVHLNFIIKSKNELGWVLPPHCELKTAPRANLSVNSSSYHAEHKPVYCEFVGASVLQFDFSIDEQTFYDNDDIIGFLSALTIATRFKVQHPYLRLGIGFDVQDGILKAISKSAFRDKNEICNNINIQWNFIIFPSSPPTYMLSRSGYAFSCELVPCLTECAQ